MCLQIPHSFYTSCCPPKRCSGAGQSRRLGVGMGARWALVPQLGRNHALSHHERALLARSPSLGPAAESRPTAPPGPVIPESRAAPVKQGERFLEARRPSGGILTRGKLEAEGPLRLPSSRPAFWFLRSCGCQGLGRWGPKPSWQELGGESPASDRTEERTK